MISSFDDKESLIGRRKVSLSLSIDIFFLRLETRKEIHIVDILLYLSKEKKINDLLSHVFLSTLRSINTIF